MIPLARPDIQEDEEQRVMDVLRSGQLTDGEEVRTFEREFREVVDTTHAVATSNGTTALHAALVGLGIEPGDRVVTTPFSFIATANAARLAGADVGFVDIDQNTLAIDPDQMRRHLEAGHRVDAVIVVHLFGLPADLDALLSLRDEYGFSLVEDAAQAHGATYRGDPVGGLGDVGCFSFYPTKNVTAAEGGMITTDDEEIAARAREFIDHGRVADGSHRSLGHNFRLSSVHAAIGRAQLARLEQYTLRRQENAALLDDRLSRLPVETPRCPDDREHVYHQYTIRTRNRDRLRSILRASGIETGVYYPKPIHRQPAFETVTANAPVAERTASEVLSLPVHPGVSEDDIDRIERALVSAVEVTA